MVASLSVLAATVQRSRTVDDVLATAGQGLQRLGMRFGAFQLRGDELVLRTLATAPRRHAMIERHIGRPLQGLSAPRAAIGLVDAVVGERRILYRQDLDIFHTFLLSATGFDSNLLDAAPETAGVTSGVLAPLFVRDEPWGMVAVYSTDLTREDSEAVALFATHVGSALEVAESLEELSCVQKELVKRERLAALGELAAVVAHEVRNPLGVLFNSIGSLRSIVDAGAPASRLADAGTLLDIAAEEADRLKRIVSDLLQFARPFKPELTARPVEELIAEVVAETSHDPRVRVVLEPDLPLVEMDRRHMRQALLNLVLNALQALRPGGRVTVTAIAESGRDQEFVCIAVADDGPGIPADLRATIFEPFFTTKASGTGLGLAIVKRIVDAHDGAISFESGDRGSTFFIRIPVSGPAPSSVMRVAGP